MEVIWGYSQIRSSAWLEHYTDNVGVSSSNLLGSTKIIDSEDEWMDRLRRSAKKGGEGQKGEIQEGGR